MPVRVLRVLPGSVAWELGIEAGDVIERINSEEVKDYLDFIFLSADDELDVLIKKPSGERILYELELYGEDLGVEVEPIRPKACRCRCIFCFMDQMPKGLRRTLYLKDDDYRLSFLSGNYITLVGLTDEDWKRIERMRLSPLYVSVHTTNPELRAFLMGHPEAADVMEGLKRLCDMGVTVHTQVVVCPGINDGGELVRTVEDLAELFPAVKSVAVVPVGLTRFRQGLFPLKPVDESIAKEILDVVLSMGEDFVKRIGSRFVFPADELFIKAGYDIPEASFYEDFFQLEDGVGMLRRFIDRVKRLHKRLSHTLFVTGEAFGAFLNQAFEKAKCQDFEVLAVKNNFFGDTVTVAGLLTGRDVVRALKNARRELVVVPDVMFNDDGLTIDDLTVDDIAKRSGKEVLVVPTEPDEFWDFVKQL